MQLRAVKGGSAMQTMRLLFVCTGNTCRSPMAAALTQQLGSELALPFRLETRSRGLYAVDGDPMSVHAQEALAERGVTADHRAAMLEETDLEWADLVLTMTIQHKRFLWEAFPDHQEKTFTLKEYIRELESGGQSQALPGAAKGDGVPGPAQTEAQAEDTPQTEAPTGDTPETAPVQPGPAQAKDFSWEYLEKYFSSLDVRDPFGGDLEDYRRTRDELEASIRRLLDLLAASVGERKDRI
jgi:protein-tyrosine phosphatase